MATIYLVRHGKAAAGFDSHADPGLDALGRRQADASAEWFADRGPLPVYSSPLARARETAVPLAERWSAEIIIEPRLAEIPSPLSPSPLEKIQRSSAEDLAARAAWLREVLPGRWSALDEGLQQWRQSLIDCLTAISEDSVIFSHFVAINAAVGAASDDDRMVLFAPDNGSITTLSNDGDLLQVLELGASAETHIN